MGAGQLGLGTEIWGQRLWNSLVSQFLITAAQIRTLPNLTVLVFPPQKWSKEWIKNERLFQCLGDSEVRNPNSLLPQTQESRPPSLLFSRTRREGSPGAQSEAASAAWS